jgi:hypothetical protein
LDHQTISGDIDTTVRLGLLRREGEAKNGEEMVTLGDWDRGEGARKRLETGSERKVRSRMEARERRQRELRGSIGMKRLGRGSLGERFGLHE